MSLFVGCNESLTGVMGSFHSPNYPGKYQGGQYCSWTIKVSAAQQIHLMFTNFSLQNENNTDALYVYDGTNSTGEALGVFYGGSPPSKKGIHSSSNQMFVIFKSDKDGSFTGFSAFYCEGTCSSKLPFLTILIVEVTVIVYLLVLVIDLCLMFLTIRVTKRE